MKALCINCGSFKTNPWDECHECDFFPIGEDLVKSVYCSTGRFACDPVLGKAYEHELLKMARDIRAGIPVIFDRDELSRLRLERDNVLEYNPSVVKILLRVSLPTIVLLLIIIILVCLRYCR